MNICIIVLTIFAAVTFGGVAHAQTAAGQFRSDVIHTLEDTDNLLSSLGGMGEFVSDLDIELTETDMSPDQIENAARALETQIDRLQEATADFSLFVQERAKHLTTLSVKQIGYCNAQRDYGFTLRMAKNALGRTLADFSSLQNELNSATTFISDQRLALSEMPVMADPLSLNNVMMELKDVLWSVDLAYSNAQKLLVNVKSHVSHHQPIVEAAYTQLEKELAAFRANQVTCVGEIARHKTS